MVMSELYANAVITLIYSVQISRVNILLCLRTSLQNKLDCHAWANVLHRPKIETNVIYVHGIC